MKINIIIEFTDVDIISDVIDNLRIDSAVLGGVPINFNTCTVYQHKGEMICIELLIDGVQPLNQSGFSDLALGMTLRNKSYNLTYNLIYISIDDVCVYC